MLLHRLTGVTSTKETCQNQEGLEAKAIFNQNLSRVWTHMSETSGTRKQQRSKPYSESSRSLMRRMLTKMSEKQHSNNTHCLSTLLIPTDRMPRREETKCKEGTSGVDDQRTMTNHMKKLMGDNRMSQDKLGTMPSGSCTRSDENSHTREEEGPYPALLSRLTDPIQIEVRESPTRRSMSTSCRFHGTPGRLQHSEERLVRTEKRQERQSPYFRKTSPLLSGTSDNLPQPHVVSLNQSGDTSSEGKPSVLMLSLAASITLHLLRRMWAALEEQKYLLESRTWQERFRQVVTGQQHGMQLPKQPPLLFPTMLRSCSIGGTTWPSSSPPDMSTLTTNSSPLTRLSELGLVGDRQCSSWTEASSLSSTQPSSFRMVLKEAQTIDQWGMTTDRETTQMKFVDASTPQLDAEASVTVTCASSVGNPDMARRTAISKLEATYGLQPKYLRYNFWNNKAEDPPLCVVDWTVHVAPLPRVPVTW